MNWGQRGGGRKRSLLTHFTCKQFLSDCRIDWRSMKLIPPLHLCTVCLSIWWSLFALCTPSFGGGNAPSEWHQPVEEAPLLTKGGNRSHASADSNQADQLSDQTDQRHHQPKFDGPPQQPICMLEGDRSAIYMSMPENTKKGTVLGTLPIIGRTTGGQTAPNIRLSVVQGREIVRLNALSKKLILRKEIDREQKGMEQFEAIIKCVPLATVPSSNLDIFPLNISVFVTVTDQNDNAPQFGGHADTTASSPRFVVQIPEELPEWTPLKLDFGATDADQTGPNSRIRYRIVRLGGGGQQKAKEWWPNAGEEGEMAPDQSEGPLPFEVAYDDESDCCTLLNIPDPFRPEIFIAGRIDFEKMPMFSVLIEAEDQGMPKQRALARLDVKVMDVDDLNPTFSSQMYKSSEHRGFTLVIKPSPIRAWDADQSFDEPIIYTLSGENSLNYAINQLTGEVRLLADKLVPAHLIVQARQSNRSERNATAFLLVEPSMEEGTEESPNIKEIAVLRIPSNMAIGTKLMHLVDENGTREGEEGPLELEVMEPKGQRQMPFFIDEQTKWLRLRRRLTKGEYGANISIKLIRPKGPPTIRSLHVRLTVVDPTTTNAGGQFGFQKPIYEFELPEERGQNGQESVELGKIRAVNFEETAQEWRNGTATPSSRSSEEEDDRGVTYALLNGNNQFDIGPTDGVLRVRHPSELPPTTEVVELVAIAQGAKGSRDFARCVVRRRGAAPHGGRGGPPPFLEAPDAALCLGLLCFVLLFTNCATLSLWLGKRRMVTLYEQLAAYRYDSVGLTVEKQQPSKGGNCASDNGTSQSGGEWMLNRSLEGDSTVTIAGWVAGKTTWPSSTAAEAGAQHRSHFS